MKHLACTFITLSMAVATTAIAQDTWMVDTQEDWLTNAAAHTSLEFKEGMAVPTAKTATFRSKLKVFPSKRSAQSLQIDQSPEWLNWNKTPNIGPANLQDAPVMLRESPGNYWMFGRWGSGLSSRKKPTPEYLNFEAQDATLEGYDIPLKTTRWKHQYDAPGGLKKSLGGYHAWHSKDMVNWVHYGPVSDRRAKWMTTGEFVDGKAYLYYDFPNDQDPHLLIDSDLTDGEPGEDMGMAFKDPSHGSDCAIIRDLDGQFHLILENWDPINAKQNAWDSPLASHAVSPDGIQDFKMLDPAVDERTTPTGKIGTYNHPHWASEDPENYKTSVAEYEIHEPKQSAYGDWAAISVGGQYYLFGDHDPADSHSMDVAMFTASSLDEQFTFFGSVGGGHPDPDIMFAEGQFYLATQQSKDFVSPGPWVDGVEVRVGVDTNKDGSINQWTDWQVVKESYDYVPGFSKQVSKTPAALDLSGLPSGYGFQYEIRISDTTENISKPILNTVTLTVSDS
ncbi:MULTISPECIES: hypothetical protein [unclassified Lentimonas]|uniref:hypothetical protein n=1 Tax=unclassified Lentimonas TaxID=2630993 RepID=UPI0015B48455|nr:MULTISPECIES: hypothetical protein [unclassified Lentimonas]